MHIFKNSNKLKINSGFTGSRYTWPLYCNYLLSFTMITTLLSAIRESELHPSTLSIETLPMTSSSLVDWPFRKIEAFLKRSPLAMKTSSRLCICFNSCRKSNTWSLLKTAWHGICFFKTFVEHVLHKTPCQIMAQKEIYRLLIMFISTERSNRLSI